MVNSIINDRISVVIIPACSRLFFLVQAGASHAPRRFNADVVYLYLWFSIVLFLLHVRRSEMVRCRVIFICFF